MPAKCFKLNEKINLPMNISISSVKNKYLVIAPKKGTYIVLDNIQLQFFNFLKKGHTLKELLNSQYYNENFSQKLEDLLIQFEFRKFYESYQPNLNKQLSARVYITNACNLRCIHCYKYSGNKAKNELKFCNWKEILQELRENGIQNISISGGEPFVFSGIYELIDYAVDDLGMEVTVLSNGIKIDFKYTSTLKKLKGIQLSIDGPTEKINDEIRGKGVYCEVMKALDKLYSIGIIVTLSMVLFDKYFEEYKLSMESFLQELKDKYGHSVKFHFSTRILPGRNISRNNTSLFNNLSLQNFVDAICEKVYGREYIFQNYSDLALNFHTTCGFGTIIAIDSTGKIYPCNLPYYPIGDIHQDSISDVISKLKDLNEKFCVDNLKPCSKCDIRHICGGTCRVLNKYLYSSMYNIKCREGYTQELQSLIVNVYPYLYTAVKGGKNEGTG